VPALEPRDGAPLDEELAHLDAGALLAAPVRLVERRGEVLLVEEAEVDRHLEERVVRGGFAHRWSVYRFSHHVTSRGPGE
jgi:hypothetical protein